LPLTPTDVIFAAVIALKAYSVINFAVSHCILYNGGVVAGETRNVAMIVNKGHSPT
jgi:hypothetical protein